MALMFQAKQLSFYLFLRAILFSLIFNLPYLYEYWHWDGQSIRNFQVDEYHYLPQALEMAKGIDPSSRFYDKAETVRLAELILTRPNALLDLAVGAVGALFRLSAIELSLVLDLTFCFFGYLIFAAAFRNYSLNKWSGELATIILLAFPQNYTVWRLLDLTSFLPNLITPENRYYSPAILRGVYQQTSYCVFGLSFFYLGKAQKSNFQSTKYISLAAFFAGLQIYLYFFTWSFNFVLCCTLLTILWCYKRFKIYSSPAPSLSTLLRYLAIFSLVSLPGVYTIFNGQISSTLHLPGISNYFYFSFSALSATVCFLILARHILIQQHLFSLLCLLAACSASELVLFNLQPLLGSFLAPFSYKLYLIAPLAWALTILIYLNLIPSSKHFKFIHPVLFCFLSIFLTYSSTKLLFRFHSNQSEVRDIAELANFIKIHTPTDSVIAVNSFISKSNISNGSQFPISPVPHHVLALTNRKILHQEWALSSEKNSLDNFNRERLLSWLLYGNYELIWPCYTTLPDLPGDLFTLTRTSHELNRYTRCQAHNQDIAPISLCESIKSYRVDYILTNSQDEEKHQIKMARIAVWSVSVLSRPYLTIGVHRSGNRFTSWSLGVD